MIAITGLPSSGKSYLLNKLKAKGYACFSCDEFIKNIYENKDEINKLFTLLTLDQNIKDKKGVISSLILDDTKRRVIENFFYHKIYEHLSKNKYDFVEIPVLQNNDFDFRSFFNKIVFIDTNSKIRAQRTKQRYRSQKQIALIEKLARQKIKTMPDLTINGDNGVDVEEFLFLCKTNLLKNQ
ncbi:dephospho-CoA kinase [Mycoplasmopsis californica]|uniref:Dephospho-CoA kinase n=1 Tax=Mycoplasmopsis equigenitalium TaxID=114883 RepID=A0ABY5J2R7_9BACT|nr:dephospho-CoA kinase [Mycoplasmopsis equigenitalium]UUD36821.1 dephospho-CoA kinase [Mycoplasmopsis equigenitalium]VEU69882.1 dephospho-CoA kinase [Mycoplasmopsis californica]